MHGLMQGFKFQLETHRILLGLKEPSFLYQVMEPPISFNCLVKLSFRFVVAIIPYMVYVTVILHVVDGTIIPF